MRGTDVVGHPGDRGKTEMSFNTKRAGIVDILVLEVELLARRKRGRSKKRLLKVVKEDMQLLDVTKMLLREMKKESIKILWMLISDPIICSSL